MKQYMETAKRLGAMELASFLIEDVRACEVEIARRLASPVETAEQIGRHVAEAGGKRLRPLFVSLAARASGGEFIPERLAVIGASMEMIHMATLLHDDVIDNADIRRGRPTASSLWGNTASILSGDVLLSKAMDILAQDGDLKVIRTASKAVVAMSEGEVLEVESRGNFDLSYEEHVDILRRKTSTFIACCCRVGAQIAGASQEVEQALYDYGDAAGIAFQIQDDLLDFMGDEERTGKPRATDFREGCATLPLIFLRPSLSEEELSYARMKFGNGVADADVDLITGWMRERGSFGKASAAAAQFAREASEAIAGLRDSKARQLLVAVAEMMVAREA